MLSTFMSFVAVVLALVAIAVTNSVRQTIKGRKDALLLALVAGQRQYSGTAQQVQIPVTGKELLLAGTTSLCGSLIQRVPCTYVTLSAGTGYLREFKVIASIDDVRAAIASAVQHNRPESIERALQYRSGMVRGVQAVSLDDAAMPELHSAN